MKSKGLLVLIAVTVVTAVVAIVVSLPRGTGNEPAAEAVVLPDLGPHLADAVQLTLVHGEGKITLTRKDKDRWVVAEKDGYPADPAKVKQAFYGLAELRYFEPKTAKPEFYPRLEVEDAGKKDAKSTLVTVSDAKGAMLGEVIAGKRRFDNLGGGTDGIYVRKPGDAQAWLARGTVDLSGDALSWLDRRVIDVQADKVKELILAPDDGSKLTIARDKAGDKFAIKDMPPKAKLKSDGVFDSPASVLADLDLNDVRPADKLSFPATGVSHAQYTTFDGLTVKVSVAKIDGKDWARFEASGTGEAEKTATELNAKLAPWVYVIPEYKAKALDTKMADLIDTPKGS